MDIRRWEKLKGEVERLQREVDRAEGVLSSLMDRLKNEHGCKSLEEAKSILEKMKKKADRTENNYNAVLEEFERKWKEVLEKD